jgi:signal transduction histidine kinase
MSLLAHEVRAPLAAIRSYSEILLGCPPEDEAQRREFLKAICEESDRIHRLLGDVSDLERLEARAAPFVPSPCDLVDLVQRAVLAVHPLVARKAIDLASEQVLEPPLVAGEPQYLQRAVSALVENAVKFTPAGGVVRVRIVSWAGAGTASVEVADNGIGVPRAAAARIFEKFYQAAVPPDDLSPRGSGLGLALVKLIAERHGGGIRHQGASPGPGSVFTLTIPTAE